MAQQLVTVGNVAGDGTGDQLRDAFTKINENFTELYSGNVQVTAANILVYTVAGRTGNIVLNVNDVSQAAAKSYVNTSIASNISVVNSDIASLGANLTAANSHISNHSARITTLEANAATQALAITNLSSTKATISYVDDSISLALSSNAILLNVDTINANVAAANIKIASLETNAASQSVAINSINANIAAANLNILSKANLSGAYFTGNVDGTYFHANYSIRADTFFIGGSEADQGLSETWASPGALFFGNVNEYFQINLQNLNSNGSGDVVVTANDGSDASHFIAMGINGSTWNDPRYPMSRANDGYLWITGGNLQLASREDNIELVVGNITTPQIVLTQSNILKLSSGVTLQFGDGSSQTSAFNTASYTSTINSISANIGVIVTNLASLDANVGAELYTMGNYQNWTSNVTTISSALDQLAQRIKNLGG